MQLHQRNVVALVSLLLVTFLPASSAKTSKINDSKSKSSDYMYRKTHTEVTITKTVPAVPVPVPIPLPINSRNADTTMSVQCDDCTDTETPWMSANQKKCSTWPLTEERCREKTQYWSRNKFCQLTCANLGFPYNDRPYIPTPSPSKNPTPASPSTPADNDTNRDGVDNTPSCILCDDIVTPWMFFNSKECATWNLIEERCKDKNQYWINNNFCQSTCARLGHPYAGVKCCGVPTESPTKAPSSTPSSSPSSHPSASPSSIPSTHPSAYPSAHPSANPTAAPSTSPSSSPTETPSRLPTSEPTNISIDSDSCVPCSNEPSRFMTKRGFTCESWHKTEDLCYEKRNSWLNNRYCELSCYMTGFPYRYSRNCCADATPRVDTVPTPPPTPPTPHPTQKQCIVCTDDPSPYMQRAGKDCNSWSLIPYRCTTRSSTYNFWERERFCQKSCFDAGHSYPGDECCPTPAPSRTPTPAPSLSPTERPSSAPSTSPTSNPTPPPTNKPSKDVEPHNYCVVCDDIPTPWMVSNGKSCHDWALTSYRCSTRSSYYNFWEQERFCELTCAKKGEFYPGRPRCCGVNDPEPDGSDADNDNGSDDDCFAKTNQCGADKPCADPDACCSAFGFCGYGGAWCNTCCQSGKCNNSDRFLRGSEVSKPVNNVTDVIELLHGMG